MEPNLWDEPFAAAEEATKEGIESIEDEGIDAFIGVKGAWDPMELDLGVHRD